MDSPSFLSDNTSPFHYQNNWILPEECIIHSQPSLFLLDIMEDERKHHAASDLSVIIDEGKSDKVFHPSHARPDCVVYPFKKDPELYCETCWCVSCEILASECKFWDVHCNVTRKQVRKEAQMKSGISVKKVHGRLIGPKKVKAKECTSALISREEEAPMAFKKEKAEEGIGVALKKKKAGASKKEKAAEASKKEKAVASKKDKGDEKIRKPIAALNNNGTAEVSEVSDPNLEDVTLKVASVKLEKTERK
jgi:hypothetical protein